MRVLLVRPLARYPTYDPEIQEPLGLESLAASLRAAGHHVLVLDTMLIPRTEQELARIIAEFCPQVAGLSLMSDADMDSALMLIELISSLSESRVAFVAGGSFVSTEPERALSLLPEGTFLIRHEGEKPLLKLLEVLADGQPITNVPSLVWGQGDVINASSTYDLVENPDNLAWPARDLTDEVLARCGVINVQGSRGCTGSCAYCCMSNMPRSSGGSWRGRSPEIIAQELHELNRKHGAVAFNFVDDDFLGPPQQAEDRAFSLADAIRRRNLRVGFGAQFRPQSLTPKVIDALSSAGLAWAFIGVENDDAAILRKWSRSPVATAFCDIIDKLRKHRVEVAAGAILFHPDATFDAVRRFSRVLHDQELLNYRTATNRLHLLPGSPLYERYKCDGHMPAGVQGPFAPPIKKAQVDRLFTNIVGSLAPIRPCWVHAACQLPKLVSQSKAGLPVSLKLRVIRGVLGEMDTWVYAVLSALMDKIECNTLESKWLDHARTTSRSLALLVFDRLQRGDMILEPRQLREAIDIEGGI